MTVKINKVSPGVKRVLINDPKTYNSLSYNTLSSLLKAFKKLDNDKELYVLGSLIMTIDIPLDKFLTFIFIKDSI